MVLGGDLGERGVCGLTADDCGCATTAFPFGAPNKCTQQSTLNRVGPVCSPAVQAARLPPFQYNHVASGG